MFKKWEGFFIAAAFLSFLLANALYFGWIEGGTREAGIFVGHWVTSIMVALTYLRVTTHAHESKSGTRAVFEPPTDAKWYDGASEGRPSDGLTRVLDPRSADTGASFERNSL
jgi:hypothetical protein